MIAEETAIERVEKNLKRVEKKVDDIETAIRGTGNPHGGLFGEFEALKGKVTTLNTKIDGVQETLIAKIDGVESKLEAKIDGVKEIFVKMFGLFKWSVGIAAVPFCAIVIPIFIEVVLPIIKKWVSMIALAGFLATTGAQAQLIIDIYPSQDNPNQTLWIFSGSSTARYGSTIRSSGNFHVRDSWKIRTGSIGDLYTDNKPTNAVISLFPLFSSTNNQRDIDSITRRLPGAPSFGPFSENTILFSSIDVTNSPTMTAGSASKSIGSIFMNDSTFDEIGVRGTAGSNLAYTNGQTFGWVGSGILNKPISDFFISYAEAWNQNTFQGSPYFAPTRHGSVQLQIHRTVIPEPSSMALVAGLILVFIVILKNAYEKRNGK